MSPFLSAVAHVSALLGPADETCDDLARWGAREGANLAVRYYDDRDIVLTAERLDGEARVWTAIGEHAVRDACAWLSWEVPRPSRVGYDANGSPVEAA